MLVYGQVYSTGLMARGNPGLLVKQQVWSLVAGREIQDLLPHSNPVNPLDPTRWLPGPDGMKMVDCESKETRPRWFATIPGELGFEYTVREIGGV